MRVTCTVTVELPDDLEEGQVQSLLGIIGYALSDASVPIVRMQALRCDMDQLGMDLEFVERVLIPQALAKQRREAST